jgi:hypothetical protein
LILSWALMFVTVFLHVFLQILSAVLTWWSQIALAYSYHWRSLLLCQFWRIILTNIVIMIDSYFLSELEIYHSMHFCFLGILVRDLR